MHGYRCFCHKFTKSPKRVIWYLLLFKPRSFQYFSFFEELESLTASNSHQYKAVCFCQMILETNLQNRNYSYYIFLIFLLQNGQNSYHNAHYRTSRKHYLGRIWICTLISDIWNRIYSLFRYLEDPDPREDTQPQEIWYFLIEE